MTLGTTHATNHLHVWTKSIDGAEFGNALYENDIDAAIAFIGIVVNVRKYSDDGVSLTIEHVMESLTEGKGMYAGVPGFVVVLSRCEGGCMSSTWN